MINGLYLSAQGAHTQQIRLDVVSNNLANASSTGFKRDMTVFESHLPFDFVQGNPRDTPEKLANSWGGTTIAEIKTDYSQNPLQATEGSLDVALAGPGFLKVATKAGKFLTRDGALTLQQDGTLETSGGAKVLSDEGAPITVNPSEGEIFIGAEGIVSQEAEGDFTEVGRIALVEPQSYDKLKKVGDNLYTNLGGDRPVGPETSLKQGFLEASGVKPVNEMVNLIETSRAFEANLNMIKFQDEALGNLLSTVPRL